MRSDKSILIKNIVKKLKKEKRELEKELDKRQRTIFRARSKRKRISEINKRLTIITKNYPEFLL